MLISRVPLRMSLVGGGTDLPGFADRYGGLVLGTSIDQYVTVVRTERRAGPGHRLCLDGCEVVDAVEQAANPFARAALERFGDGRRLELVSFGDVPTGTGLGSSGAFAVALLGALRPRLDAWRLADEACQLEIDRLGRPVGRQDQYLSALGGLRMISIGPGRRVTSEVVTAPEGTVERLARELLLFYTGVRRDAGSVLAMQSKRLDGADGEADALLHETKTIAADVIDALRNGDTGAVGIGLDRHWRLKRRLSGAVTLDRVDVALDAAREAGATGGKLLGAGGGGFLLVHCPELYRPAVRKAMTALGLVERSFSFDHSGHRLIELDRPPSGSTEALRPTTHSPAT